MDEKIDIEKKLRLLDKVRGNCTLSISRVPEKSLHRFKELADSDFASDYGQCLKWLLDFYDGIIPNGFNEVMEIISDHEKEIHDLKQKVTNVVNTVSQPNKSESNKDKIIKFINGRTITIRR
jgi:hypothetical protein